jgi:hypothetical protein
VLHSCIDMEGLLWCARQSPALPAGAIPAPARGPPPHREPSLGFLEVTTWAKRRQGDRRAVTHVKPKEPREKVPDADTLAYVEGQGKATAAGQVAGSPAGSQGMARVAREASEAPGRSIAVWVRPSRSTAWTNHRTADAAVEVGSLERTPRAGKPRPGGSEGAGHVAAVGRPLLHPEAGPRGQQPS